MPGKETLYKARKPDKGKIRTNVMEQIYKDMVELSPDGIFAIDADGKIISCNTAATALLGYSKEELIGRHFARVGVFRPEDIQIYTEAFDSLVAGQPTEPAEISITHKNGSQRTVDIRVGVIRLDDRVIIQITARDITERIRMEQEIRQKNRELMETQEQLVRSEKLAAIGQLASGVGHELRNPLGAIKNAAYFIRRKLAATDIPAKEPRIPEFLDIIDEEVNTANKVITDLLGFSRISKPVVSPASVLLMVEDALERSPLPDEIEKLVDLGPEVPDALVDADQMRQVFTNIIANASQAMPEGGRLTIRARGGGNSVIIEFEDTGCGIPQDNLKKIFDPLFTTKAKGIGLGLSVCKSIVERHGGSIGVASETGKGATFTITLPASPPQAQTAR